MSNPNRVGFTRRKLVMTAEFLRERLAEAEANPEKKVEFYWYLPMEPKPPATASGS